MLDSLRSVDSMTAALSEVDTGTGEGRLSDLSALQNELIRARDSLATVVDETTAYQISLDDVDRMKLKDDYRTYLSKNYIILGHLDSFTKQSSDSFATYNSMYDVYSLWISMHNKYDDMVLGSSIDEVYDQAIILKDDARDQEAVLQRLVDAGVLGGDISVTNQFVDGFAGAIVELVQAIQANDYNPFMVTIDRIESQYNDQAWNNGWSRFFEADINQLSTLLGQVTQSRDVAGGYYQQKLM